MMQTPLPQLYVSDERCLEGTQLEVRIALGSVQKIWPEADVFQWAFKSAAGGYTISQLVLSR